MATANSIAPFPDDIDREAFANWLSGFVAGEACFQLVRRQSGNNPAHFTGEASVAIGLRADDSRVLAEIQSFWQCGRIMFCDNRRSKIPNAKPTATYTVKNTSDLTKIVVPHFERYPLRAKKQADFEIWKTGVALLYRVRVPQLQRSTVRDRLGRIHTTWTREDRDRFLCILKSLRQGRAFEAVNIPDIPPAKTERTLYDIQDN